MLRVVGVACHGEHGSTKHASTREIPVMEASQERAPRLHGYLKRLPLAGWEGLPDGVTSFDTHEIAPPHQMDADAQKEASSYLAPVATTHEKAETSGYAAQQEGEPTVGP